MAQAPYCSRMAKPTPWKDEYTLLCEKCGYVVEGLDTAEPCPECGKPIAESLPERRIGTPWQQNPRFKSLIQTWWMTLRHPKKTANNMLFEQNHTKSLRRSYWYTSGTWIALLCVVFIIYSIASITPRHNTSLLVVFYLILFMTCLAITPLIILLTTIEAHGLIFFSKRRESRMTKTIAVTITTHGCAGWTVMAFGGGTGLFLWLILSLHSTLASNASLWFGLICIGFGFLFFEFFAYLGLRRCKFANRMRPQSDLTEPAQTDTRTT